MGQWFVSWSLFAVCGLADCYIPVSFVESGVCAPFHSALAAENWCVTWLFCFSCRYSVSRVLQTTVILVSEIQDH